MKAALTLLALLIAACSARAWAFWRDAKSLAQEVFGDDPDGGDRL